MRKRDAHEVDVRHLHARVGQAAAVVGQAVGAVGDEVVRREFLDVRRDVLGPRRRRGAAAEHVAAELVARLPRCAHTSSLARGERKREQEREIGAHP